MWPRVGYTKHYKQLIADYGRETGRGHLWQLLQCVPVRSGWQRGNGPKESVRYLTYPSRKKKQGNFPNKRPTTVKFSTWFLFWNGLFAQKARLASNNVYRSIFWGHCSQDTLWKRPTIGTKTGVLGVAKNPKYGTALKNNSRKYEMPVAYSLILKNMRDPFQNLVEGSKMPKFWHTQPPRGDFYLMLWEPRFCGQN